MADGEGRNERLDLPALLKGVEAVRVNLPLLMQMDQETGEVIAAQILAAVNGAREGRLGPESLMVVQVATLTVTERKEAAEPPEVDDAPLPCIYTGKGMARPVFEFLVLRWLQIHGRARWEKRDIYNYLTDEEGLNVGSFGAFCTRLAQLKELRWISWPDNAQLPPIRLTTPGRIKLAELRTGELKPAHRDYLANTIDWSGLKDTDEPDDPEDDPDDEPTDA